MGNFDAVLFDLDDTLHDDSGAYRQAARDVALGIAQQRGIDAEQLVDAYIAQSNAFWKGLTVDVIGTPIADTRERLWTAALADVGITGDRDLVLAAADAYTRRRAEIVELFPGAADLLVALRARGCKLGIVTNGFAATHHEKIDRLGLRSLVDAVFLADEVGMVKPDPAMFRLACETLGVAPERSVMVGDRYDRDIIGGHHAGLFTILIDIHRFPIPAGSPPPDVTVATVGEVLAAIPFARDEAVSGAPNTSG